MVESKTAQKTTYMWDLGSNSQETGQESAGSLERKYFCYFLIFFSFFHFLIQNYCQKKKVSLCNFNSIKA